VQKDFKEKHVYKYSLADGFDYETLRAMVHWKKRNRMEKWKCD